MTSSPVLSASQSTDDEARSSFDRIAFGWARGCLAAVALPFTILEPLSKPAIAHHGRGSCFQESAAASQRRSSFGRPSPHPRRRDHLSMIRIVSPRHPLRAFVLRRCSPVMPYSARSRAHLSTLTSSFAARCPPEGDPIAVPAFTCVFRGRFPLATETSTSCDASVPLAPIASHLSTLAIDQHFRAHARARFRVYLPTRTSSPCPSFDFVMAGGSFSAHTSTHVFGRISRRGPTHSLRAFIFSVLSSRKFGSSVSERTALLELLSLPAKAPGVQIPKFSPRLPRSRKLSLVRLAALPTQ
jgi:hypothetical protein